MLQKNLVVFSLIFGLLLLGLPQLDTIPSITQTAIPEGKLYHYAQTLIGQLKGLRNEFVFATLRLKDDMPNYLEEIRNRISDGSIQIMVSRNDLSEQTVSIDATPANEEWRQLWGYFLIETDKQKAAIFDIEDYSPEAPVDNVELSNLYHSYLTQRYCRNLERAKP